MKKLLYISTTQFGYHTISVNYCNELANDYDITFVSIYEGKEKVYPIKKNIKVIYHFPKNRITKIFSFSFLLVKIILRNRYHNIFIVNFKFSIIVAILTPRIKKILDIRTGDLNQNKTYRYLSNLWIKITSKFYSHTTIISKNLGKQLKLGNFTVLPLGANKLLLKNYIYSDLLTLIYIGTLHKRDIDVTIDGVNLFIKKTNIPLRYIIIGKGNKEEEKIIQDKVVKYNLTKQIEFLGYIPFVKLRDYLEQANVGISYVPLVEYYQNQPPTKTFEYLLAGLPVIATRTNEHKKIINDSNGVLIYDNAKSFCEGIEKIYNKKHLFNRKYIQKQSYDYEYSTIVREILIPVLRKYENN